MLVLTANVILALMVCILALRLVSKKHHCEKWSFLFYSLLFFLCVTDLQLLIIDKTIVEAFWWCALAIGGGLMIFFTTSKKSYYYIKNLDLTNEEQLGALQEIVRQFVQENLKPFSVELRYRSLTFNQVPEDKEKELVKLIDEYLSANNTKDDLQWRKMIIFAVIIQIIFISICLIYNISTIL